MKEFYSLDAANNDLCQGVDEGLQDLTGVDGAENSTPEVQAVDVLPVID